MTTRETFSVKLRPETVEKYRRPASDHLPAETNSDVLRRLIARGAAAYDEDFKKTGRRYDQRPEF